MTGREGKVFDEEMASAPPAERSFSLLDDVRGRRRQLDPHRHFRHFLDRPGDHGTEDLVLSDVRSHVDAVHVRAGEIELQRVDPLVLAGLGQRLPVVQLLVVSRSGHDRGHEHALRIGLLDPAEASDPPVERFVRDQFPVPGGDQGRVRPLGHRQPVAAVVGPEEFRLRAFHVDHRVQPYSFRYYTSPARLERPHDVAVRLGRWGGRQQERVLETNSRKHC